MMVATKIRWCILLILVLIIFITTIVSILMYIDDDAFGSYSATSKYWVEVKRVKVLVNFFSLRCKTIIRVSNSSGEIFLYEYLSDLKQPEFRGKEKSIEWSPDDNIVKLSYPELRNGKSIYIQFVLQVKSGTYILETLKNGEQKSNGDGIHTPNNMPNMPAP